MPPRALASVRESSGPPYFSQPARVPLATEWMEATLAQIAEIKCINKNPREDRYHSITHVGGYVASQWKLTLDDAIGKIERGEWNFYTVANGHRADVIVAARNGRKYLKTTADYDTPDNLLSLPECP
jgi:hypothetical protein